MGQFERGADREKRGAVTVAALAGSALIVAGVRLR